MARALEKMVCTTSGSAVGFAECMAFNQGIMAGIETLLASAGRDQSVVKKYSSFRKRYGDIYAAEPVKRVALFESRFSMAFSNYDVQNSDLMMHELLLSRHIPFDLLYDTDALDNYRVIILPNMQCLTEAEINAFINFVQNGGNGTGRGLRRMVPPP
jgi:hypothetical protein